MERIKKDLTAKIENKLKKKVESMYKGNLITKEMKGYLIPKGSRPGKVQGNPKMHKKNNPCRVIINGNKHSTENMTEIVENELAENVRNLNSYIKDTTDFLRKLSEIQQPLPKGAIMFCFDVKALYPSVPRKEARTACQTALQGRTNKSLTTECVLDMLDLVLENNNFSFNDNHYYFGMNYACTCTFLGDWEKELLQKSEYLPAQYGDMLMIFGGYGNTD